MVDRRRSVALPGASRLALAQGGWSAVLLLSARPVFQALAGEPIGPGVIGVARVLGVRQLLQALATARRPTRRTLQVGAAVDTLHAATMIAAAAANLGPRRLTSASAAMAGASAVAGVAQSHRR